MRHVTPSGPKLASAAATMFLANIVPSRNRYHFRSAPSPQPDATTLPTCRPASCHPPGIPKDLLNSYPAIKAFRNKIANLPAVKAYYQDKTEESRASYKPDP